VSSINNHTDSSIIWKKIRSIKRTNRNTSPTEVANNLRPMFQNHSGNSNYDQDFLANSYNNPSNTVDPKDNIQTHLSSHLLIEQLEAALLNCKSKSPGPDSVTYILIKNISTKTKKHLPLIYNSIWSSKSFPNSWRNGYVIPILKPDKNKFLSESYHPICLLNTLCKLLENMINNRLIWFLEKSNYLTNEQNGFRRNRSTTKNILNIKNEI